MQLHDFYEELMSEVELTNFGFSDDPVYPVDMAPEETVLFIDSEENHAFISTVEGTAETQSLGGSAERGKVTVALFLMTACSLFVGFICVLALGACQLEQYIRIVQALKRCNRIHVVPKMIAK